MGIREVNKIAAAVLVSGIAFFVAGLIGDMVVRVSPLKQLAIKIEAPPPPAPVAAGPAVTPSIAARLAKADPAAGEAFAKKVCGICHTFTEGGKAVIGPNLYNVVGGPHAQMAGFAYSDGLKALSGDWSFEELDAWLTKPSSVVAGTKMAFPGIPDPQLRANVIAWLRTLSATPVALPEVKETALPAAAAPGELPPVGPLLAKADPKAGEAFAKTICLICHTATEGGKAVIGPNLYDVVGAPHGHMAGFVYSAALKAKPGPWTYDELNNWLYKPAQYAPGTKMAFPGIPDAQLRANVIAWLRSLSADPQPLP